MFPWQSCKATCCVTKASRWRYSTNSVHSHKLLQRTHVLLVAQALVSTPDLAAEALARQQTSKWNSKADQNTQPGAEGSEGTQEDHIVDDGTVAASRTRRVHGSEADRLVFNPQEGWEDMIGQVVRKR